MKTFTFRLESVLRWRRAQLEAEEFALSQLAVERAGWDGVIEKIETALVQSRAGVLSSANLSGGDLAALAGYLKRMERERQVSFERRRECDKKIEQQRARLLAARREFRLLEKLRQLRRDEWEATVNREFEALSAESYLARFAQRTVNRREPSQAPHAKGTEPGRRSD
jgi:hypothetical protein